MDKLSANPPPENVQIVKISDGQFYRATTSATMIDVAEIKAQLAFPDARKAELYALLAEGAAHGVGDAAAEVAARTD